MVLQHGGFYNSGFPTSFRVTRSDLIYPRELVNRPSVKLRREMKALVRIWFGLSICKPRTTHAYTRIDVFENSSSF